MMSEAVLLGLSPQGLSVLRMLSRRQWRIHVFSDTAHCAGYYSKYGEKHLFADIHDLKQQLQKIAAAWSLQHPDQKMRCIIANGVILASILRDYPEIYQDFLVEPSPLEWVRQMCHKDQMYRYGISKGFTCAKFQVLSELKPGDLHFPFIVKRNYEVNWSPKVKVLKDQESLDKLLAETDPLLLPDLI